MNTKQHRGGASLNFHHISLMLKILIKTCFSAFDEIKKKQNLEHIETPFYTSVSLRHR